MSQHRNGLCLQYSTTCCTICLLNSLFRLCCLFGNSDRPYVSQRADHFSRCCCCLFCFFICKCFSTGCTGPVLVISGFRTGGLFAFYLRQIMAKSCNLLFFHRSLCRCIFICINFSTGYAGPVFMISSSFASRIFCLYFHQLVACGCDHLCFCGCLYGSFCIREYLLTGGTGPVFMISGFCTSCLFGFCLCQLVAER